VGGGGLEWRGDGELELTSVRVDGGGVLGVRVGNWRMSERIETRRFCWCRCAREMGSWGSLPSSPRRRRGGGRGARLGGVARGRVVQCEGEWGQEVAGVPRVAVEQQEVACGPPRRRRRRSAPTVGEAGRERGGRRLLDLFAISKKIQGSYCKTKIIPKLGLK
jgi:hypothetical protein